MTVVVRTRLRVSPADPVHIAAARVAAINWLWARSTGGTFTLWIEDSTGSAQDRLHANLDDLRWLGLDWDDRLPAAVIASSCDECCARLIAAGRAYHACETVEELAQMRRDSLARGEPFRYRPKDLPVEPDLWEARRQGRSVVLRFRMPDAAISFEDAVLGPVTIPAEEHEDFVLRDADGRCVPPLTTVLADARIGTTHAVRGQRHLPGTARQIALQQALGLSTPVYAHLPLILNPDGSRLSRADSQADREAHRPARPIDLRDFRAAGYLPEALLEYLAQLGVTDTDPSDRFGRQDLVGRFDIRRIGRVAPRLDRGQLAACHAEWLVRVDEERRLAGLRDCLGVRGSPLAGVGPEMLGRLLRGLPGRTFAELDERCRPLFVLDEQVVYDDAVVRKALLKGSLPGLDVLAEIEAELASPEEWCETAIRARLEALARRSLLGSGRVSLPLQVAIFGRPGGPPVELAMELLGPEASRRRIRRCLAAWARGRT